MKRYALELLGVILVAVILAILVGAKLYGDYRHEQKAARPAWDQFITVVVDPLTGCHYLLIRQESVLLPRLTETGEHLCEEVVP